MTTTPLLPASFKNYWVLDTDYLNFAVTYSCMGGRKGMVYNVGV